MVIVGLTGSIGMGKSETARMFRRLKVPVFDADAAVHRLLGPGGAALTAVEAAFPGVTGPAGVDRQALGAQVFGKPDALRRLEKILHPRVGRMQRRFLAQAARRRRPLIVLDIPLLFEGRGEARCDLTVAVSAPPHVQRARVLARPGMNPDKFANILRQQVPDVLKRQRADVIVPSGLGLRPAWQAVRRVCRLARRRRGHCWPPVARPRPRSARHPSRKVIHALDRSRYRNHRT